MLVDHFAHNDVVVALPDNRLYLAFHRADRRVEDRRPASTAQERLSRQSAVLQLCRLWNASARFLWSLPSMFSANEFTVAAPTASLPSSAVRT